MSTLTLPTRKAKKTVSMYVADDIKSWLEAQSKQRKVSQSAIIDSLLRQAINQTDEPLTPKAS